MTGAGFADAWEFEHAGDPELMARLRELPELRLHCFGHIHGGYGSVEQDGVVFVNAALLGPLGDIDKAPVVLRMNER